MIVSPDKEVDLPKGNVEYLIQESNILFVALAQ